MFKFNNSKTNWKYILIVAIVAFIVGGGILGYQYWFPVPYAATNTMPESQTIEIPLEKLKDGENKIGNITIERIKPKPLCYSGDFARGEFGEFNGGIKKIEVANGKGESYELTCDIENKAKVKVIVSTSSPDLFNIENILVIDNNNKIIAQLGKDEQEDTEFDTFGAYVSILGYNKKIYFLLNRSATLRVPTPLGIDDFFLYVINEEGNVKNVYSWSCDFQESCHIAYGLGINQNLYLEVEKYIQPSKPGKIYNKEIWQIGKDDIIINKFPANKIIIEDGEVSFQ